MEKRSRNTLIIIIIITCLYHFIPLSLTFTLTEGHEVGANQNFLASFSGTWSTNQDEL